MPDAVVRDAWGGSAPALYQPPPCRSSASIIYAADGTPRYYEQDGLYWRLAPAKRVLRREGEWTHHLVERGYFLPLRAAWEEARREAICLGLALPPIGNFNTAENMAADIGDPAGRIADARIAERERRRTGSAP